jgi:hypothetical protein
MKFLLLISALCIFTYASAYGNNPPKRALSEYQKNVIVYFNEVALGYEYGTATKVTRKWNRTMKIFMDGAVKTEHILELEKIVSEINTLVTDNFRIEIVNNKAASNLHLYIGSAEEFSSFYPSDATLAKSNSGIYRVFWNRKNEIVNGYVFIRNTTTMEEQKHAIREELTQTLGLGQDSPRYEESIFQLRYTLPTEYAPIDKDLIRLLYHPRITIGLAAEEVESILADILLSESKV